MKNIHILPTDKQSRLFVYDGKLGLAKEFQYGSDAIQNQNINITDDSGIKIGDWVIDDYAKINLVQKVRKCDFDSLHYKNGNWKKIILTTDQDLIKEGVQAIDDEFLEWFVKNPSCEEVIVTNIYGDFNPVKYEYKIFIPKEEPKQELENHYLSTPNPLVDTSRMKLDNHSDLHKQETLEEAAKKIYPINIVSDGYDTNMLCRTGFYIGYELGQERSYSEEEVLPLLEIIQKCKEYFLLKTDKYSDERADAIINVMENFKKK